MANPGGFRWSEKSGGKMSIYWSFRVEKWVYTDLSGGKTSIYSFFRGEKWVCNTGKLCPINLGYIVAQSLVFCVVFCRSLIVLLSFFLLVIVLSVLLQSTDSDYHFGIFKLFLKEKNPNNWVHNLNSSKHAKLKCF